MAGFSIDEDRKVIPRWRSFSDALELRELDSVAPPRVHQTVHFDYLAQKIIDWRRNHTVGHAADLVGAAIALGREQEAARAAKFLLQDNLNVSPWARELAEKALGIPENVEEPAHFPLTVEESTFHTQLSSLRRALHIEPRDPITWVELARVYAILGLGDQAKRSMVVGLQLANNNRFVLRSASRLWVHFDDPERAHHILIKADRTQHDPWLLAAEIAVGSIDGGKPKLVKIARKMLTDGRFSRSHISELASAVATLELEFGSIKKSRKLFRLALEDPTENSVAQVAWASRQHNAIRFEDQYLTLPNAFEAKSWVHYQKSQWKNAVEQCERWQFDQPFSSRPSGLGSYVAAVALEDYETSKQLAKRGLIANPVDFTLLNNLAFACINLKDFVGAKEALSKAKRFKSSDEHQPILQATKGLMAYRTGNLLRGRQLYSDARSKARSIDDNRRLALATTFHAIEEICQEESDSDSVLSEAFQALKREHDPIFRVLEKRLKKMIDKLPKRP